MEKRPFVAPSSTLRLVRGCEEVFGFLPSDLPKVNLIFFLGGGGGGGKQLSFR